MGNYSFAQVIFITIAEVTQQTITYLTARWIGRIYIKTRTRRVHISANLEIFRTSYPKTEKS